MPRLAVCVPCWLQPSAVLWGRVRKTTGVSQAPGSDPWTSSHWEVSQRLAILLPSVPALPPQSLGDLGPLLYFLQRINFCKSSSHMEVRPGLLCTDALQSLLLRSLSEILQCLGWWDCSAVENILLSRGPEFGFQNPCQAAHNHLSCLLQENQCLWLLRTPALMCT